MSVQIVSSTETPEAITAAIGGKAPEQKADEQKSAPAPKEQGESTKASEALENESEESEGEESEESEGAEDSKEEEGEKKPKRSKGVEKKISKLTRRVSEREQEIERLRQENDALRRSTKPSEEQALKPEAKADGEPKAEDFDTHADYIKAVAKWTIKQEAQAAESKKQAEASEQEYKKLQSAHVKRLQEFVKTQTDFDEVIADYIADHGDLKFSDALEEAILTSDLGPAIVYELARNPEELRRINSLGSVQAGREIEKLETKLAKSQESSKTEIKKTTGAPPPVKPVGAKSGVIKKSIYDANLSQREYEQLRAEQN